MWTPEDTHKVTEAIYKNITSNFNNGVRQILTAGKAYHKSLVGMTSSAHSFIEAIGKVGYACQINGQGGTDEIGGAILKLADIQKEMYARVEECTKALFTEVILPLEHRLENDFKHAYAEHKKYQHGHKGYLSPYIKAQEALKKFRKKSKSKLTYDDSKEIQYVRAVAKFQEKLTDFRTQGLKLALLEERKCYCYLLERLTTFATVQSSYTKKGFEMLASEIPRWKQLCSQPHILPRALDPLLNRRERREQLENSQQNGMVYADRSNYGSPYHRPVSNEFMRQKSVPSEYAVPAVSMQSKTLPRGSPSVSQNSQPCAQVTAIYAHVGRNDDQLSFNDGDMITLIGEKSDGWQYGFNANTGKYGWFPLSFTDTVNITQAMDHSQLYRAKSIGDLLDSKSQISDISMSYEMEMPGRSRRPRSLYECSMGKHVNSAPQSTHPSPMSQWSNHLYHTTGGDPSSPPVGSDHSSAQASSGFHTLPRPTPQPDLGSQELYCSLPEPYNDPKPPGTLAPEETQTLTLPDPPLHVITLPPVPSHPPPSPPCVTKSTPQHEHQPLARNLSSRSMLSGSQSPSYGNQEPLSRSPSIREPVPFDNYSVTSFRSSSSSNLNTDKMHDLTTGNRSRANTFSTENRPLPYQGIREKIQTSFNDRPTQHQTTAFPRSPFKSMPFPPPPPPPPVLTSSSCSLHPDSCLSTHLSQMLGSGEMSAHTLPRHHSSYQPGQQIHHHNHLPPPPQNQMVPPPPQAPPPTQAPMAPPPPPPITNQNQSWGSNSGFPPPPPPTDYHTDEDDQSTRSQMFANVSLRKTQTNDRSAPKLK